MRLLKKEPVFCVSAVLCALSFLLVPPTPSCLGSIDWRVLALLLGLMLLVACVRRYGLFDWLGHLLVRRCHSSAGLETTLVLLCFFSSMLITNDVALITFVPFALYLLEQLGHRERAIRVVVLQTIAANLGSMLTPIGNPQNLYLYSASGLSLGRFLLQMLPLTVVSLALLCAVCLLGPKKPLPESKDEQPPSPPPCAPMVRYAMLFLITLGTVLHLIPWPVMLAVLMGVLSWTDRSVFRQADYYLLGTFAFFFLFVGNIQQMDQVCHALQELIQGRVFPVSVLASQVISNVPAAILLSGFTEDWYALLLGTNVGGLGTLVASLASLISYKYYAAAPGSRKGAYLLWFTVWNLLFLAVLSVLALCLM